MKSFCAAAARAASRAASRASLISGLSSRSKESFSDRSMLPQNSSWNFSRVTGIPSTPSLASHGEDMDDVGDNKPIRMDTTQITVPRDYVKAASLISFNM